MKKYFVVKLISEQLKNPAQFSEEDKVIMQKHSLFWKNLMEGGNVLVYGPVLDPNGAYGLGIVTAEDKEVVYQMLSGDPAKQIAHHEVSEMLAIVRI